MREATGFPHATAIAKCTEAKARFAVLANPPGFIDAFSPILAIDKSYDNPVFAIPYARLMLERLGATAEAAQTGLSDGVDMSVLKLPEEVALARCLSDWPLALERAMRKRDAFYLASFLQALSLLFFQLKERVHPISSNYLTTEMERPARFCLLGALDRILIGGRDLLGVDAVKEYG
jgi:arginyl-tRNA synthetase